jgi:hypothetical protein
VRSKSVRPWALPVLFTLVTLSLPAQILVDRRVSEPYPGFFMPPFGTVPRVRDNGFGYYETQFFVAGRRLKSDDVFQTTYRPRLAELIESTFPMHPNEGSTIPVSVARRIRANIGQATGSQPSTQMRVVWQRRRFDAATQRSTKIRTESAYDVDLLTGRLR